MSSKAQRLSQLYESNQKEFFLPLFILDWKSFIALKENDLNEMVIDKIGKGNYAVRSSAKDEDQLLSQAGKYLSLMNVEAKFLVKSIQQVFDSYGDGYPDGEVFIQRYLSNSEASGVLFSKDPNTGSNYFVVNFAVGSDTQKITSGSSNGQTIVIHNSCVDSEHLNHYPWIANLIKISKYCANFLKDDSLDIEFAVVNNFPTILQVRHLATRKNEEVTSEHQTRVINEIQNKIVELQEANPFLVGKTTVLGVMPDWNPAELIGIKPNTLALSLFKELITDSIWAYERSNLGYRSVRSFPLLIDLAGHPYIDFRTSVNSLLPNAIDISLAEKLANLYINRLAKNPSLHDKVEFDVIISCFTLDFDEKIACYTDSLSSSEISKFRGSLIELTKNIILGNPYGLNAILAKHQQLEARFSAIAKSDMSDLSKIYWLIEDCKRHGTLPFGGIARAAFIATSILNSIVQIGVLTENDIRSFYENIDSSASTILPDIDALSRNDFISKYGHLRPGTFDINTPNYENAFDSYFPNTKKNLVTKHKRSDSQKDNLIDLIAKSGVLTELGVSARELINFAEKSIASRESIKFNFSKSISLILELIANIGEELGFSRKEMSQIHVQVFLEAYKQTSSIENDIRNQILNGRVQLLESNAVWLPPIITSPHDVKYFELPKLMPNFVTQKSISAETLVMTKPIENLDDKIILIESADPGFDWIFTRKIAGIVTCYGGANSHMAVRAKEVNIPSAIGVGEEMFQIYSKAKVLRLDCEAKFIEVVR
jgi:phosphohistidine swiveling domain-containing protein